ncbi:hypothetical protein TNCV_1788391 [Trichonephila clavipes]|nr:hypothetical protein TNCV_1788391 [Trichonephila clavipes]
MATAELRYKCITRSFLIDECQIIRIFQLLHRQLRETRSFHVTRHDAGRQKAASSPSQDERILDVVAVRPESSTRAAPHHVSESHLSIKRKSLTPLPFSANTGFESDRLFSSTASGWYRNVSCSWTS